MQSYRARKPGGNARFLAQAVESLRCSTDSAQMANRLLEADDLEHYLIWEMDEHVSEAEREVMKGVAGLLGYPGNRDARDDPRPARRFGVGYTIHPARPAMCEQLHE